MLLEETQACVKTLNELEKVDADLQVSQVSPSVL